MIWVKTQKGKRCPLDAEPSSDGNWIIQDEDGPNPLGLRMSDQKAQEYTGEKHRSHFETCPQAGTWSKREKT